MTTPSAITSALATAALAVGLLSPPSAHAAPESAGFKFVGVGGGQTTMTLPIPVSSPSSGLDFRVRLPAGAGGDFSVVKPDGSVLNAAAITAAGGHYIDLSNNPAWTSPDPVFGIIFVPAKGRLVNIHLPGEFAPGTYGLRVDYPAPLTTATLFQVNWDTREQLRTRLFLERAVIFVDQDVVLGVGVLQGTSPVPGTQVECTVLEPDGDESVITLLDDGVLPDGQANDGMFAASFTATVPGQHLVRAAVTGASLGDVPFSRTLISSFDVCRPGARFSPTRSFTSGVERTPAGKATRITLSAPVDADTAGTYTLLAKLTSPLGTVYDVGGGVALQAGEQGTITIGLPVLKLPQNPENGGYTWSDATLSGPTSCSPSWALERRDPIPGTPTVLLNQGDWPAWANATVTWQTLDPDNDQLFDTLVATVTVRAEFGGIYRCSASLIGWCEYPHHREYVDKDDDVQELVGSGQPGQFTLTFRACYTDRVNGQPSLNLRGIGPVGLDGPYGLVRLSIDWADPRGPAPFLPNEDIFGLNRFWSTPGFFTPPYANSQFECHELRPDFNHNGKLDWCEIQSGSARDRDHNGIIDDGDQPPCRPPCCPPACNLADVTDVGGDGPCPDGQLTVDDMIKFVNDFGAGDLAADVTGVGGPPSPPDGILTVDDLIAFVNAFGEGCPGAGERRP